jgi:hypothetical protein
MPGGGQGSRPASNVEPVNGRTGQTAAASAVTIAGGTLKNERTAKSEALEESEKANGCRNRVDEQALLFGLALG